MDEQLNNDLKNRINDVFDRFEAPEGAADAGWTELRKRYPADKKRRAAAWWWSSAAVLLALLLLTLWLYKPAKTGTRQMVKTHTSPKPVLKSNIDTIGQLPQQLTATRRQAILSNHSAINSQPAAHISPVKQETSISSNVTAHPAGSTYNKDVIPTHADTSASRIAAAQQIPASHDTAAKAGSMPVKRMAAAGNLSVSAADSANTAKKHASMEQIFAQEALNHTSNKNNEKSAVTNTDKSVMFSVYTGTYLNYAKGSNNQLGAGAGFNSDIKLAGRLKLVTGLAIGQNSLSYNGLPASPAATSAANIAVAKAQSQLYGAITTSVYSIPGNNASASYTTHFNSVNAGFTNLEIPLNFKYLLSTLHTDNYLMAGVSSGTFLNETYSYIYNSSQSAISQSRFGTFDLARTLNVAYGVGMTLGKSNRLVIEPFFKYPLGGMGTQQIRLGAGGVNLKFNLLSHK